MKKNGYRIVFLCALICVVGFFYPCTAASIQKIKDINGQIIELPTDIKRVVVLNSNALESMLLLDSLSAVAGVFSDVDKYDWLYPRVKKIPTVGRWNSPNMEVISRLEPDVILTYRKNPSTMLEKQAALFGIRVVRLDLHNMETFEAEFMILAKVLGKEKEAVSFIEWKKKWDRTGDQILRHVKQRPSIYVENFAAYKSLGKGSAGYEMLQKIGVRSITENFTTPYPLVGDEWILRQNPNLIVKVPGGATQKSALMAVRRQITERPLWSSLTAVQKNRLGILHTTLFSGPRGTIGRLYLLKWAHPKEGQHIDPDQLHREYYRLFLRQPYQGVWVLPPEERR